MKKLIYILLGFCVNTFAQNPVIHKMTYYTKDANNKDSILCEDYSIEDPYSFGFRGKTGTVFLKNTDDKLVRMDKENLDVFCYIPEFADYDRNLEVRMAASQDLQFEKAGFIIAKKPITELNAETIIGVQKKEQYDSVFCDDVFYEDPTAQGFALSLVTEEKSYNYNSMSLQYNGKVVVSLGKPEYCVDYFIRPYLITSNGDVMFGTEKKFSTLNTIMGALAQQGKVYARVGNTIITQKAIEAFAREHEKSCVKVLSNDSCMVSFVKSFDRFMKDNNVSSSAFEDNIASVMNCVDGTLAFVEELPSSIKADYWNALNQEVTFDLINDVCFETDKKSNGYTQNIVDPSEYRNVLQFDPSWGVGDGNYFKYQLIIPSRAAELAYDVPRYLLPGKYKLYVTIVTPPEEQTNIFKVNIFEANENGELNSTTNPNYKFEGNSENSYFVPDSEKIVETICVGEYEFGGASKNLIQFVPKRKYTMSFAEIKLVPVTE